MSKRIAIIGSGISGLTCAYLLSKKYNVYLFEANDYLGGHTATKTITTNNETIDIDTGFIVFNEWTYPNFIKLLQEIGVNKQATEMSFSVFNQQSGFEYNGHTLWSLFSQKKNIVSPKFYYFLWEIIKFNLISKRFSSTKSDSDITLIEFLYKHKFSEFFAQHYILPMVAAIWSGSLSEAKSFPFKFFHQFFLNHGLLNIINRPQWYVVGGGSKSYIPALIKEIRKISLSTEITSVFRHKDHVTLNIGEKKKRFDEVIFACHSDQALSLLGDSSDDEKRVLGRLPYRMNDVTLHTDISKLPKYKESWASWNFMNPATNNLPPTVTYNMNILQSLTSKTTYCVSLNQKNDIDPNSILGEFTYAHPVINQASLDAQSERGDICGKNRTHFCGAYWYQGFHEDGVKSALDVCKRFGISL